MISVSEFEPFDRNNVLFDEDTWEYLFEETVRDRPEVARALGLLLYDLLDAILSGQEKTHAAANTLKLGIEWLYRHTGVSNAAFVAFVYYLAGALPDPASLDRILAESTSTCRPKRKRPARNPMNPGPAE